MKRKNMTKFDKAVSAAFTGHRFYNFSQQEVMRAIDQSHPRSLRAWHQQFYFGIRHRY